LDARPAPAEAGIVFVAYFIVTIATIMANAYATAADLTQARFVLATLEDVGLPRPWLPRLAALKGAAVIGLLLGLIGVRPLGIAAAIGLVLFFTGALATHVRTRVFHNIAVPGAFFALAAASTALAIGAA
jgi:DoxX-like family